MNTVFSVDDALWRMPTHIQLTSLVQAFSDHVLKKQASTLLQHSAEFVLSATLSQPLTVPYQCWSGEVIRQRNELRSTQFPARVRLVRPLPAGQVTPSSERLHVSACGLYLNDHLAGLQWQRQTAANRTFLWNEAIEQYNHGVFHVDGEPETQFRRMIGMAFPQLSVTF